MFPFRSGNFSFQTSDDAGDQDHSKDENQVWLENVASAGVGGMTPNSQSNMSNRGRGRRGRRRSSSSTPNTVINSAGTSNNNDDDQKRKTIHREVERQRRQEMSGLFTSLRSILPTDYIKGKRSTSDHLEGAVNYIKNLEKNVKDLGNKRDQLKASIESTNSKHEVGGSSNSGSRPGTVVMFPRLGGLDIEISVGHGDEGFSLSSALQIIFEEGLDVASYTSTKVDERLIHNILCEVSNMTCIDVDRLQQRLIDLVW